MEGGRLIMVISNWVEKKLEERRTKREQALIEMGRKEGIKEGIELGRTLERERIAEEVDGEDVGELPSENKEYPRAQHRR